MASYLERLFSLDGQVAIVTGGTGVLGGALCEGIAKAGATVVVAGNGKERGDARVEAIRAAGGKAVFRPLNVGERASWDAILAFTVKEFGKVDILINGAGVNAGCAYQDVKDEDFQRVLDINLTGTHLGCQIVGKAMIEQKSGAILNIGSVTSDKPLSRVFAYSASKAAVVNLTENVAREYAPFGVRVNALCPGFFPAEQNRKILDATRVDNIMRQTPMARFGEPDELVGCTILLLAPKAGSFITGSSYYVDGGFTGMRF